MPDKEENSRQGIYLEFTPVEECPKNHYYVIRTIKKFEVRDEQGRTIKNLLEKE